MQYNSVPLPERRRPGAEPIQNPDMLTGPGVDSSYGWCVLRLLPMVFRGFLWMVLLETHHNYISGGANLWRLI